MLCIHNVRLIGTNQKIVRAVYSKDGENWFEDSSCTTAINITKGCGTSDDVLFFVILAAVVTLFISL